MAFRCDVETWASVTLLRHLQHGRRSNTGRWSGRDESVCVCVCFVVCAVGVVGGAEVGDGVCEVAEEEKERG